MCWCVTDPKISRPGGNNGPVLCTFKLSDDDNTTTEFNYSYHPKDVNTDAPLLLEKFQYNIFIGIAIGTLQLPTLDLNFSGDVLAGEVPKFYVPPFHHAFKKMFGSEVDEVLVSQFFISLITGSFFPTSIERR